MSRQHYSVAGEAAERFENLLDRREDESATELLHRACDRLEEHQSDEATETGTDVTECNGLPETVLTTDDIPDIVAQTSDKSAKKVLKGIDELRY
ncbi:hypothetical protein [Halalkalicoccus jeotgali]|uniref:Uncharacterized protein n=1 Tax=Halalkalicoccus jeotgali (strain DSM 18796 / CECT 7217 / JCM 14584 / KCTC 4019 / B3) TaxID=795797 RepID=D8J9X4_HALJB|nr:hypothetical protein [Halalkalicoccus jeotgali]ADJ14496.1 hypothetical protein HacjB3_05525 [Halalkalicoccus jeotgali B3]ELY40208.1 hypothetical protein C497_03890 [Halalkalicoccus jeotgali B3]